MVSCDLAYKNHEDDVDELFREASAWKQHSLRR